MGESSFNAGGVNELNSINDEDSFVGKISADVIRSQILSHPTTSAHITEIHKQE